MMANDYLCLDAVYDQKEHKVFSYSIVSLHISEETILATKQREKETERERERVFQRSMYFSIEALFFDQQNQGRYQYGLLHAKYMKVPMCTQRLPLLKKHIGHRSKASGKLVTVQEEMMQKMCTTLGKEAR